MIFPRYAPSCGSDCSSLYASCETWEICHCCHNTSPDLFVTDIGLKCLSKLRSHVAAHWCPGNTGDNHSAISAPCHVIADTQAVVMVFSMRCVEVGGATLSTDWWWLPVPCAVWEKFLPSHRLTLNITAQYTMELKFFSCESIFINR